MKHIVVLIIIASVVFSLQMPVAADEVAGRSAHIDYTSSLEADIILKTETSKNVASKYFIVKKTIRNILERYNSPLVNDVDSFVTACRDYNLDCYLLPAIMGLESTFGKFVLPGSYNPFGWGGGHIVFDNWDKSIQTVGKGLRENYINKGALSLDQIGRIYSESTTWAPRVQFFINQMKTEEEKLLYFYGNNVEL